MRDLESSVPEKFIKVSGAFCFFCVTFLAFSVRSWLRIARQLAATPLDLYILGRKIRGSKESKVISSGNPLPFFLMGVSLCHGFLAVFICPEPYTPVMAREYA